MNLHFSRITSRPSLRLRANRTALWALAPCLAFACEMGKASPDVELDTLEQALDFPSGSLEGSVSWNGVPLTGLEARGPFAWIPGPDGMLAYDYVKADGRFAMTHVPPGSYALDIDQNGCGQTQGSLGGVAVSVSAGETSVADIDLAASAGRVSGFITTNGVALPHPMIQVDGLCGSWGSDEAGAFVHLLPPGQHSAKVFTSAGVELGRFQLDVDAGASVDVGTLDFSTGTLQGSVSWNGAPLTGLEARGPFAWIPGPNGMLAYDYVKADGHYAMSDVPPGSYGLDIDQNGCGQTQGSLGGVAVSVSAGEATTADVDLTASAGRVSGFITTNGVALPHPMIQVDGLCGSWGSDEAGAFAHLLPPGQHSAKVFTSAGVELGRFELDVDAGASVDIGRLDFSTGTLQGSVSWNGSPVSGLEARGIFTWIPSLDGFAAYAYVSSLGDYTIAGLEAGSHVLNVEQNGCGQAAGVLRTLDVSVSPGATTRADVDLSSGAGRVKGFISSNGVPVLRPMISVDGLCGSWGSDETGAFAHFVPPGQHVARVFTSAGVELGRFGFAALAAETTDVDIGTTPAGSFVSVSSSGGTEEVGGIDITFVEVTTSGQTTVVESGFGPPPPSGYRIVGIADEGGAPRYWDIDTSASYVGAITVCIHYDEGELRGPEGAVRLVHDAGDGFADITTSLDTVANVVCGVTDSLSPFAVVEPAGSTNLDAESISAEWVRRRHRALEVSGSFTNAGSETVPEVAVRIFLDLNADSRHNRGEPTRSITQRNVRPGASRRVRALFDHPPRGRYSAILQLDPLNLIAESNERDNLLVVRVRR